MDRPPAVMTKAPRPLLADGATCLLNAKTDAFPTDFFADKDRDDADVEVFEVDDFKLFSHRRGDAAGRYGESGHSDGNDVRFL